MPNFVNPPAGATAAVTSTDPVDRATMPVQTDNLGYLARRDVARHLQRETVGQVKAAISEERRQAQATTVMAIQGRAAINRAEIGRTIGESLAAVAGAAYESHKAISGLQGESRVIGTLANFEALNAHASAIDAMVKAGKLTPEQARIAMQTAQGVHAETEQRLDRGYGLVRDATDANLTAALAPLTQAMPKG